MTGPLPYVLHDSGEGRKLETLGDYRVDRQAGVALWRRRLGPKEWKRVDAFHHRSETGGGHWEFFKKPPESWLVTHGGLTLKAKLTSFGHFGFFAEQAQQWAWFRKVVREAKRPEPLKVINLFGYTGGTSLSLALEGAEVTHVDAAKNIVDWGKQNAELNQIRDGGIRWIVDDCLTFVKREARRGKKYDGIILDPPSYGRGPNKEVFKIEDHLVPLLEALREILAPKPALLHLSCHSPGFTPEVLKNLLYDVFPVDGMLAETGEMVIPEAGDDGRNVPSGTYCRLR